LRLQLAGAESLATYLISGAPDKNDCRSGAPQD
jgi:hypothetical protein